MRIFIFILSLIINFNLSFATNSALTDKNQQPVKDLKKKQTPISKPFYDFSKLPDLGDCSKNSDYYIYECQPFKCTLPLANNPGVTREMTTLGFQEDKCLHNFKLKVRHPDFKPGDVNFYCKLTPEGRAEMAKLFTRYKNGDIKAYTHNRLSKVLAKECR